MDKTKGTIIESDNLPALDFLCQTYKSKIQVCIIDPPYNTNISGIGYEDNFDDYSEMIKNVLIKLNNLLKENGVVFISIDVNEVFSIANISKKIFGSDNVDILVWKKVNDFFDSNRKHKPIVNVRNCNEYIILIYKNKKITNFNKVKQPYLDKDGCLKESEKYLESIIDWMGTTSSAKDELSELLGDRNIFSTPKPMKLFKELIRASTSTDSIILDCYAGSGTTGHSTMDLNKEDGGQREFILITNNESDICNMVTIPRIKNAICKNDFNVDLKIIKL